MDKILVGILIGFFLISSSTILLPISESAVPPTNAFQFINYSSFSLVADSYRDTFFPTPGTNILLTFFSANDTMKISANTTNTISMEQLSNVTDAGCASGQIRQVNATGWWTCTSISVAGGNATVSNDLGDFITSSPAYGHIFQWSVSASAFINKLFNIPEITCPPGQFLNNLQNDTLSSCGTPAVAGGASVLAANVTGTLPGTDYLVWTIPLTANSGNTVSGVITATSTVSGTAVSAGANVTNLNTRGFCHWVSVATTTTDSIDNIVMNTVATDRVTKNAETLWIAAANVAQPINFQCSVTTGPTAGNLMVFISPEASGATVAAKAGSFYIKTP